MNPTIQELNNPEEIREVLEGCEVLRLGLSDGPMPYIIPMNFGCSGDSLYFHSAPGGRKISLIRKNPTVSFQCERDEGRQQDRDVGRWRSCSRSVMGTGEAVLLEDNDEKRTALEKIMRRYDSEMDFEYSDEALEGIALIRVIISEMKGRRILR